MSDFPQWQDRFKTDMLMYLKSRVDTKVLVAKDIEPRYLSDNKYGNNPNSNISKLTVSFEYLS